LFGHFSVDICIMNGTTLLIGLITGSVGSGFFIYGKKQRKWLPMLSGVLLCIAPYFVENLTLLVGLSIVLCAVPFVIKGD